MAEVSKLGSISFMKLAAVVCPHSKLLSTRCNETLVLRRCNVILRADDSGESCILRLLEKDRWCLVIVHQPRHQSEEVLDIVAGPMSKVEISVSAPKKQEKGCCKNDILGTVVPRPERVCK